MKFICDDNLGKLAKYLRILGFDTRWREPIGDNELLRIASAEERYLITRDHGMTLHSHPFGMLLVEDDDPLKQLNFVIRSLSLKIDPARLFSRCSLCNVECEIVDKSDVSGEVFPFILKTQETISRCPSCRRYYWKGSHYKRLVGKLRQTIQDENIEGNWPEPV